MCPKKGATIKSRYHFKISTIPMVIVIIAMATGCEKQQLPSFADSLDKNEQALQVIETSPHNEGENVELNTYIQATFNTYIDTNRIYESSFIIREGNDQIEGTISTNDSILTFYPAKKFNREQIITAIISAEISDTAGNNLNQDYEWTFTTRPLTVEERTPPSVASTIPQHGATDMLVSTDISAQFTKSLNPETINSNTFYLQNSNGSIVSGSVSYVDSIATFSPSGSLQDGTEYTATITVDIEDLFGHSPDQNYNWTFRTKEIDRTPPRVASTNPQDNERNVDDDIHITVTFNEAMDPATINTETFLLYKSRSKGFRQISGSVTYSDRTARFIPNEQLSDSKNYVVIISDSVTDLAGNTLRERYTWSFVTEDD